MESGRLRSPPGRRRSPAGRRLGVNGRTSRARPHDTQHLGSPEHRIARTVGWGSTCRAPQVYSGSVRTSSMWMVRPSTAARPATLPRPGAIGFVGTRSRRRVLAGHHPQQVSIGAEDERLLRFAQPARRSRPGSRRPAGDRTWIVHREKSARRRLLLEGDPQLAVARLERLAQTLVAGDRRLVGEGPEERHLLRGERLDPCPADDDEPDGEIVPQERDDQHGPVPREISRRPGYRPRAAALAASRRWIVRRSRMAEPLGFPPHRDLAEPSERWKGTYGSPRLIAFQPVDVGVRSFAEPRGGPRDGLEDGRDVLGGAGAGDPWRPKRTVTRGRRLRYLMGYASAHGLSLQKAGPAPRGDPASHAMGQKVVRRPPRSKRRPWAPNAMRDFPEPAGRVLRHRARPRPHGSRDGPDHPAAVRLKVLERLGYLPAGALDDLRAGASSGGYRAAMCLFSAPLIVLVDTDASNVTNHPFRDGARGGRDRSTGVVRGCDSH